MVKRTSPIDPSDLIHAERFSRGIGLIIAISFLLMGGIMSYFVLLRPVYNNHRASQWIQTPCRIESSAVKNVGRNDNPYRVDIRYGYTFQGRNFQSGQYDYFRNFSPNTPAHDIVRRHPAGSDADCFVNPDNPSEAVLSRDLPQSFAFRFIPLLFFFVGAVMLRSELKKMAGRNTKTPGGGRRGAAGDGESRWLGFKLDEPQKDFAVTFLFCAFWVGVCSVFFWQVAKMWMSKHSNWWEWLMTIGLTLFMTPFAFVCFLLSASAGQAFFRLFNPRLKITLSPARVSAGDAVEVTWQISGRVGRLRRLKISLLACENIGADTSGSLRPDDEIFHRIEIADNTAPVLSAGNRRIVVPEEIAVPKGKKAVWEIEAHGEIDRWPDLVIVRPVRVHPRAGDASAESDLEPADES